MKSYKEDFPLLMQQPDTHYLDSAATSQRPKEVIDAVNEYYSKFNGNAGRGSHKLAVQSSQIVEEARKKVAEFIGAKTSKEIVFTKCATESLNIIAYCYGLSNLTAGDEVLICVSNHHANIVPWQYVCKQKGAVLKYVYLNPDGSFNMHDFKAKLNLKTKIVSVSAVVNTTGVINPVKEITKTAHAHGAIVVIDGAQSIPHCKQNLSELGCDFFVFSGHKIFSLLGVGILYGKTELLEKMPPFLYGGSMISYVTEEESQFKDAPEKYEGGTMNVEAIYSLHKAIEYIERIGYDEIERVVAEISDYALSELKKLDFVETYQTELKERVGVIAFNVKDVHSHDTAFILDQFGVMVRSGHHCTQPLMNYINVPSSCRASFGIYNTKEDVDKMIIALKKVNTVFNES
ncbi:MAG: cysteine desulfurase [Treponema sp.]|nr:MAG: cysteine desulfurase [Treponema sp.]